MKIKAWFLCVLLLVPALVQAQLIPERGRLFVAARYSELEKLVESEIQGQANPPNSKLVMLCAAYGKLKRYNKLFPCIEQAEANVKRGDTAAVDVDEMRKNSPLLMGFASLGSIVIGGSDALKGDVRPMLAIIKAEAYTELRDYDKAIAAAKQAFDAIPQRWHEERSFRIQALTALGLSHAFAGKKAEATQYAETLADLSTSYPYTGLTKDKVMGVAKITWRWATTRRPTTGCAAIRRAYWAPSCSGWAMSLAAAYQACRARACSLTSNCPTISWP